MRNDAEHGHWMAATLNDYPMQKQRAEQLARELRDLHDFMQREGERLMFEDEPSTFRRVQSRVDEPNGK
jgi:hypothetical protein